MSRGWLLLLAACTGEQFNGSNNPAGVGSGSIDTEVAVENVGGEAVSATLISGDFSELFDNVPAGTATDYRVIDWEEFDLVEVTIDLGVAQGGEIGLLEGLLNVVVLSDTAAPVVETYSPDPGGGDPGGGAPGW